MTRAPSDLPMGRLIVVCVVCLIAGAATSLLVSFLLYPVLPRSLHRDSGWMFFAIGAVIAIALYGRAKARLFADKQDGS